MHAWAKCMGDSGSSDSALQLPLAGFGEDSRSLHWTQFHGQLDPSWRSLFQTFERTQAGQGLRERLAQAQQQGVPIYPPTPLRALALTPLHAVRVVVLGQDPYHGPGQANGLAFSVGPGQRPPPSLRNILKEVVRDIGKTEIVDGQLEPWARQGVLLVNRVMTVEDGRPASHQGWGWEAFSADILRAVDALPHGVAFLLWGAQAQAARDLIDEDRHRVFTANHPSPLSANRPPTPFVGCGHFSAVNRWLKSEGQAPITW